MFLTGFSGYRNILKSLNNYLFKQAREIIDLEKISIIYNGMITYYSKY